MCHLTKNMTIEDGSSSMEKNQVKHEAQSYFQGLVTLFTHAYNCIDTNCELDKCYNMKKIIAHFPICKRKNSGECAICNRITDICYYHYKKCTNEDCSMKFCSNFKKFKRESVEV